MMGQIKKKKNADDKKRFRMIYKHPILSIIIAILVAIVIPIAIILLFQLIPDEIVFSPGELLSYCGSVFSAIIVLISVAAAVVVARETIQSDQIEMILLIHTKK